MKSMDKAAVIVSAALLTLSLAACQAQQREEVDPTEPIVQLAPSTQAATEPAPTQAREDVVELVSPSGESTTVYLLADGRYLDRQDRFFTFDGLESWTSNDGTVRSRKSADHPCFCGAYHRKAAGAAPGLPVFLRCTGTRVQLQNSFDL